MAKAGIAKMTVRRCWTFAGVVLWIVVNSIVAAAADHDPARHIVLIAGAKSHGEGEHEYLKSVKLLKVLVDRAPNLQHSKTEIYFNGWPEDPDVLDRADTIAFFSDGEDRTGTNTFHAPFMTDERMEVLNKQMKRGCGFMTFHFSTFAPAKYAAQILEWTGGYFDWQSGHGEGGFFGVKNDSPHEQWHSAIRVIEADVEPARGHPITEGVSPFHFKEEFYYQLRFQNNDARIEPILRVPVLSQRAEDQVVGWAIERKDGGRGFGTTTGHYFNNWQNDNYRKLILNALVWTAGIAVPKGGVESTYLHEDEVDHLLAAKSIRTTYVSDPAATRR